MAWYLTSINPELTCNGLILLSVFITFQKANKRPRHQHCHYFYCAEQRSTRRTFFPLFNLKKQAIWSVIINSNTGWTKTVKQKNVRKHLQLYKKKHRKKLPYSTPWFLPPTANVTTRHCIIEKIPLKKQTCPVFTNRGWKTERNSLIKCIPHKNIALYI